MRSFKIFVFVAGAVIIGLPATGRVWRIDSQHGSDEGAGTKAQPWRSFAPLEQVNLAAGDQILIASGSRLKGCLAVRSSGTGALPIRIGSYGPGKKPEITNPEYCNSFGNGISVDGEHVLVENLFFVSCPGNPVDGDIHKLGAVFLSTNANHCVVTNCEFTSTPVGVSVYGEHNVIAGNWVHDNNAPIKAHWGPMGIVVCGARNEISYNRIENYCAPSREYGHDGGAIEINDRSLPKEDIHIHHNLSLRNQGFIEWVGRVKQDRFWIHHNVCMDYQSFLGLTGPCTNFRIEHNTVVRTLAHKQDDSEDVVFWNYQDMGANTNISFINNIFVYDGSRVEPIFSRGEFEHAYNLFFRVDERRIGKQPNRWSWQRHYLGGGTLLRKGDRIGDPRFVNFRRADFRLRAESPAAVAGTNLNYSVDFDGHPMDPQHPSAGAYEVARGQR